MTRDFLKPQKTTGLDTNAPVGKRSRFAPDPFSTRLQPKPQQPDLQTLIQRGLRLGDPMAKAWANVQPTVDSGSQPSVQAKHEQPDLQTLIQRGLRLGDPMAKAWANMQPTVQQEAMPEEEKEENLQMKADEAVQPEELEEEETLQTKSESTIQRQELEEEDETLQTKAERTLQREELPEEEETVQTKLTIGQPGDKYEQEADNMAAQVMSMPDPTAQNVQRQEVAEEEETLQQKPLTDSITPVVQRQTSETQPQDNASQSLESQLAAEKGGGSPLSDEVQAFMEPRFGADFSEVRVHTGSAAVQMNQQLGAQAFTHGNDIYYGKGKAPGNDALTAHELTHTIQQDQGIISQSNNSNVLAQKYPQPSSNLTQPTSFYETSTAIQRNTVIEMPEMQITADVYDLIGQTPSNVINNLYVQKIINAYTDMRDDYQDALNNFEKKIETPTSSEVRQKFAQDIVMSIIDIAVKTTAEATNIEVPGAGFAIGLIYDSLKAGIAVGNQASQAMEQISITDFVTNLRTGIGNRFGKISARMEKQRGDLLTRFNNIEYENAYENANDAAVGEQAVFLRSLEQAGDIFYNSSSAKTVQYFETKIWESWINSNAGVIRGFWGPEVQGYLDIRYKYIDNYDGDSSSPEAEFLDANVKAPQGGRTGERLNQLMHQQGTNYWDLNIRKVVRIQYYDWGNFYDSRDPYRDAIIYVDAEGNETERIDPYKISESYRPYTQLSFKK